jgi:hypothetical protein
MTRLRATRSHTMAAGSSGIIGIYIVTSLPFFTPMLFR